METTVLSTDASQSLAEAETYYQGHPVSIKEFLETIRLLAKRLPTEIVSIVVNHLEPCLEFSWSPSPVKRLSEYNYHREFFETPFIKDLNGVGLHISRIVAYSVSHDQGWVDAGATLGTRDHSWTWGRVHLQDSTKSSPAVEVYRNFTAVKEFQIHRYSIQGDELKHLLRDFHDGFTVCFVNGANFAGWDNHIAHNRIQIHLAV